MKILFVTRLFSAIEEGLLHNQWTPMGVPAIYKLLETLDTSSHDILIVFTCKDEGSKWDRTDDITLQVDGISAKIIVIAGEKRISPMFGFLRRYISMARHVICVWKLKKEYHPDVVYIDRVNIWSAAILARFTNVPVILRLLGIVKYMKDVQKGKRIKDRIWRWAYTSPFFAAICTLDGSGGGVWMDNALNMNVKKYLWINGVDKSTAISSSQLVAENKNALQVLFVGRLEEDKGLREFILSIEMANDKSDKVIQGIIVGYGTLSSWLVKYINNSRYKDNFQFLGAVPHSNVLGLYKSTDIYVSLNKGGNLSNTNLESLISGSCIIFPSSKPDEGIDSDTDKLIPGDVVIRLDNNNIINDLACKLIDFSSTPKNIQRFKDNAINLSKKIIPTWNQRINQDITLIESVNNED